MNDKYISIAKDFNYLVGLRYKKQSSFSGEEFRDNYIVPIFDKYDTIYINLDGTGGLTASFLDEVFGGLVKKYTYNKVINKIGLISNEDNTIICDIKKYMIEATFKNESLDNI